MNWASRLFSPRIEDSLRLRVLTVFSLWLAALAQAWVGGNLWLSLIGGGLGTLGNGLGWRWRHQGSLIRSLFIAGLVIFPALFASGLEPDAGPGLLFVTMANLFARMPAGQLFSIAFFLLLLLAGLLLLIVIGQVLLILLSFFQFLPAIIIAMGVLLNAY